MISSLFSVDADPLAAAAPAGADEARVGAVARGDVPLQQPPARRALPDDPVGRALPDRDRSSSKGESRTIGRPYYDFFLRAFGLPLLLLMGIGPLIAWRRTSVRALLRMLVWPIAVALVTGVVLDRRSAPARRGPGLIAYTFSAFVLADDRGRARSRHAGDGVAVHARSRGTAGATAATSCTPRSCCSRSASPARAPTARRPAEVAARASRRPSAGYHAHLPASGPDPERPESNRTSYAVLARVAATGSGTLRTGDVTYTGFDETDSDVGHQDRLAARRRIST